MKLYRSLLPLAAAMILAACGRGPAQSILSQADGALAGVKDEAATSAPHELQAAQATYSHMKQSFDSGEYKVVKADVPKFNEQMKTLKTAMEENQGKVAAAVLEWQTLNVEVPKAVQEIQARVDSLKPGKLPKDVTKEELETAKADLEAMKAQWAEASAAAQAANPIEATEKGRLVQAKASEVKDALGMNANATLASAG
jgi:hypothetical protein